MERELIMVDLLKCPFCGDEPQFPSAKETFGTFYECGCDNCGIATISLQIIDCFDYPRDLVHDSWDRDKSQYGLEYIEVARNEAVRMWNSRVN